MHLLRLVNCIGCFGVYAWFLFGGLLGYLFWVAFKTGVVGFSDLQVWLIWVPC